MSQNYILDLNTFDPNNFSIEINNDEKKKKYNKISYTYSNNESSKYTFITGKIKITEGLRHLENGYFNIVYDKNQQSIVELFNMADKIDSYLEGYISKFTNGTNNEFTYFKNHQTKETINDIPFHDYIKVKFYTLKNKKSLTTKFFNYNNGKYEIINDITFDNINEHLKKNHICQFLITIDSIWSNDKGFGIVLRCSEVIIDNDSNVKCILETLPIENKPKKIMQRKTNEKKPNEKKPNEKKPNEKKTNEKKPNEKKPNDKKPNEKNNSEMLNTGKVINETVNKSNDEDKSKKVKN